MMADARATILEVSGLSVEFGDVPTALRVVDRVAFELHLGESLGVVGESGSGKSVMARALLGLLPSPTGRIAGGSVKFQGAELVGMPEKELRTVRGAKIAMVFQEPGAALDPVFTIGSQIMETLAAHHSVARSERRARAIDLLAQVGIPAPERRVDEYPHQLSGGMKQRALIAIALSASPVLLIADEPTTALDATVQAEILELLGRLRREREMSMVFISHDLAVVSAVSDRVAVMYAGEIVEIGTTRDVLRLPRHPYTRALLRSRSLVREGNVSRFPTIPGRVPDFASLPGGCRFHPRCDRREARCTEESVGLSGARESRVRCHFPIVPGEAKS